MRFRVSAWGCVFFRLKAYRVEKGLESRLGSAWP